MAICPVEALTLPQLSCDPSVGGISKIELGVSLEAGADYRDLTKWTFAEFDSMPEASGYNSVYTYDKQTNVGVWTTTVTLVFGEYTEEMKTVFEKLHYKNGRPVKLHTENGRVVTVPPAVWTGANINPGVQKTDGLTGNITLVASHRLPLDVVPENI